MRLAFPLALGALALSAAPSPSPAPLVLSAYLEAGRIRFDSPIPIPWDSLVPPDLRQTALAHDTRRRRELFAQRSEYGTTEVAFPVSLPTAVQRRFYYLLDSTGIHEIRPLQMVGTARISWAERSDSVLSVTGFGSLDAKAPPGSTGGFVLVTEGPVALTMGQSARSADALLAPKGGTYVGQGSRFRQIIRQYEIRQTGSQDRWIWVQWHPDTDMVEAGCVFRFSLFHVDAAFTQVATTDTGCDV